MEASLQSSWSASTVSKAAEKSNAAIASDFPLCLALVHSPWAAATAVTVDLPLLNPNWESGSSRHLVR